MFSKGGNGASGDQKLIRKGSREQSKDIEMIDADPILNNMAKFAKVGPKNKSKGDRRTNATNKAEPNLISNFKKGIKDGKKMVKQAGYVDKVTGKAGSLTETNNEEPDTTVTAKFAGSITQSKGTAIFSTTIDSTAVLEKDDVEDFNNKGKQSIQNQKNQIDKMLDNRNQ